MEYSGRSVWPSKTVFENCPNDDHHPDHVLAISVEGFPEIHQYIDILHSIHIESKYIDIFRATITSPQLHYGIMAINNVVLP